MTDQLTRFVQSNAHCGVHGCILVRPSWTALWIRPPLKSANQRFNRAPEAPCTGTGIEKRGGDWKYSTIQATKCPVIPRSIRNKYSDEGFRGIQRDSQGEEYASKNTIPLNKQSSQQLSHLSFIAPERIGKFGKQRKRKESSTPERRELARTRTRIHRKGIIPEEKINKNAGTTSRTQTIVYRKLFSHRKSVDPVLLRVAAAFPSLALFGCCRYFVPAAASLSCCEARSGICVALAPPAPQTLTTANTAIRFFSGESSDA